METLHVDYTYELTLISRNPHMGRLPRLLALPFSFLADLQDQVAEGPQGKPAWRKPEEHLLNHESELSDLQAIHLQLLARSKQALKALREHGDSTALQEAEQDRLAQEALVSADLDESYLTLPTTMLATLMRVMLAFQVTGQECFQDYRRCFHMVLVYPQRDVDQLNINLTFKGYVNRLGKQVVYTALAGYHCGISGTYGNAGRPVQAVYLGPRSAVTTVFGEAIHTLTEPFRPGLMTTLRPGEILS